MAFCKSGNCSMSKTSPKGYPQCSKCGRVDITAVQSQPTRKSRSTRRSRSSNTTPSSSLEGEVGRLMSIAEEDPELGKELQRGYYKNRRSKD